MGFRLVPKSVTLNDSERCNGRYFTLLNFTFETKLRQTGCS